VLIKGRDEYTPRITLHEKDGYLCLTESKFFDLVGVPRHVEQRLEELEPGLFFPASGIALDLTGEIAHVAQLPAQTPLSQDRGEGNSKEDNRVKFLQYVGNPPA